MIKTTFQKATSLLINNSTFENDPARVNGVDTDYYLGAWDADVAYMAGVRFVFVRGSQNTWPDAQFRHSWDSAKDVMPRGAYCYLTKAMSNDGQARTFAGLFNGVYDGNLPIVVDMEEDKWYSVKGQRRKVHLDASDMEAFLAALPKYLSGWDGRYIIYTGWSWWVNFGSTNPKYANVPLWIANPPPYSKPEHRFNPAIPKPFTHASFIQFSFAGDGKLYGGSEKGIDLNYYMGSYEDFEAQFVLTPPAPAKTIVGMSLDYSDMTSEFITDIKSVSWETLTNSKEHRP